jgi:hypothetical protein
MTVDEVIKKLLEVLPDSEMHIDDISWEWCWNELSDEVQQRVKEARRMALDYLRRPTSVEQEERREQP